MGEPGLGARAQGEPGQGARGQDELGLGKPGHYGQHRFQPVGFSNAYVTYNESNG